MPEHLFAFRDDMEGQFDTQIPLPIAQSYPHLLPLIDDSLSKANQMNKAAIQNISAITKTVSWVLLMQIGAVLLMITVVGLIPGIALAYYSVYFRVNVSKKVKATRDEHYEQLKQFFNSENASKYARYGAQFLITFQTVYRLNANYEVPKLVFYYGGASK